MKRFQMDAGIRQFVGGGAVIGALVVSLTVFGFVLVEALKVDRPVAPVAPVEVVASVDPVAGAERPVSEPGDVQPSVAGESPSAAEEVESLSPAREVASEGLDADRSSSREDFRSAILERLSEVAETGEGSTFIDQIRQIRAGMTSSDPVITVDREASSRNALEGRLGEAVANDPFQPSRNQAPEYRLPWERRAPVVERDDDDEEEERDTPDFRVVGTAVFGDGGSVLVQTDEETKLVAIGESIEGYRLQGLTEEAAVFSGRGWEGYTMPVREPRATGVEVDERGRVNINLNGRELSAEYMRRLQDQLGDRVREIRFRNVNRRRPGGGEPDLEPGAPQ